MKRFFQIIKFLLLTLSIVILVYACSNTNSNKKTSQVTQKNSYKYIITKGDSYFDSGNFKKAEEYYEKALKMKITSEVYLNLVKTNMILNNITDAENYLNKALIMNPVSPEAPYLKAKFIYSESKGENIDGAYNYFKKADKLGHKESKYYVNIIKYARELQSAIVHKKYSQWYYLTFPDAAKYFFKNKNSAIEELKQINTNLENQGAFLSNWEYELPIEVFSNNNSIICKIRTYTVVVITGIEKKTVKEQELILVSLNNGDKWYSMAKDEGYRFILKKYFPSNILDKIF